jgi:hypothetical protein
MVLFRIAIFIVVFRSYYLLQLSSLDVDDSKLNKFLYRKRQLPKHFIDFAICFLLLSSNRSDFLVIPEDELPGLVKL